MSGAGAPATGGLQIFDDESLFAHRVVFSYAVVRAMGRLTTKLLALNVAQYRAKEHFDQVKDLWYGVRTPDGR